MQTQLQNCNKFEEKSQMVVYINNTLKDLFCIYLSFYLAELKLLTNFVKI